MIYVEGKVAVVLVEDFNFYPLVFFLLSRKGHQTLGKTETKAVILGSLKA